MSFLLKFNTKNILNSVDISYDEKYFAYSTSRKSYLYKLRDNGKYDIKKLQEFPPSKQVIISNNLLIILQLSYKILCFDFNKSEFVFEYAFHDMRESAIVFKDQLYLSFSKSIIDLKNNFKICKLEVPSYIINMSISDNICVFLVSDNINNRRLIHYQNGKYKEFPINEKSTLSLSGNVLFDDRFLSIYYDSEIKKYEIDSLIQGIIEFKGDLVILQKSWNYLKSFIKPSVFKSKYCN